MLTNQKLNPRVSQGEPVFFSRQKGKEVLM